MIAALLPWLGCKLQAVVLESCPGPAPLPYIGPLIAVTGPCILYLFLQVQSGCDM